ncbi:MAG: hypothetical protein WKF86_11560 [Acidimicrobiales bacterium]
MNQRNDDAPDGHIDQPSANRGGRTPLFGTRADRLGALQGGAAAALLTAAYVVGVRRWAPADP